jgi:hypothetical protein
MYSWHELRKKAVMILSAAAVLAAVVGVYRAIHSSLFTVEVVEVTDQLPAAQAAPVPPPSAEAGTQPQPWTPVDAETITDLAAVPVGQSNLFDLDLSRVEKRILTNEWIREVRLQKRFPQTLSITAIFKEPKAIVQLDTGALSYVDQDGKTFGKVILSGPKNLALISNADSENPAQLQDLLKLLSDWEHSPVSKFARIETLSPASDGGSGDVKVYRLMISYNLDHHLIHSRVDLGSDVPFSQLTQVFDYLHSHGIAARQIFADAGKKIVVKTAHGS